MNPTVFPPIRGLLADLPPPAPGRNPICVIDLEFDEMPGATHDFLVQNGRPDLVRKTYPNDALEAVDLP